MVINQLHVPATWTPMKGSPVLIEPQSRSERLEENFLTLPRIEPHFFSSPTCSLTMNERSLIVTLSYTDS
jgi:hypothetical protein